MEDFGRHKDMIGLKHEGRTGLHIMWVICQITDRDAFSGLVGIVPALGMMSPSQNPPFGPLVFSSGQLLLWSLGLAFFGVFIAVPLRTQTIIKVCYHQDLCLSNKMFQSG